ncbi:hypothetical protein D5045_01540 [Verminephrobacter eiseniae]|nr:hypothetical protein [Verminephrobacter eiseniae]
MAEFSAVPESFMHFAGVACCTFVLSALRLRVRFGNGINSHITRRHDPSRCGGTTGIIRPALASHSGSRKLKPRPRPWCRVPTRAPGRFCCPGARHARCG